MRASILVVALALGQERLAVAAEDPHCASMPTMAGCSGAKANKQVQGLRVQPPQTPPPATTGAPDADVGEGVAGDTRPGDEKLDAFAGAPTGTAAEWTAAHQAYHRELDRTAADPKLPDSGKTLIGKIKSVTEERDEWLEQRIAQGKVAPELLGRMIALTKGMTSITTSGHDLAIADDTLKRMHIPDPRCPANPDCAQAQEAKQAAGIAVNNAFMGMPEQIHGRMMLALDKELRGAGWRGMDTPSTGGGTAAPGAPPPPSHNQAMAGMKDPDAQVYVGNELGRSGDLKGAESAFSKALSLQPNNVDALAGRADARYNLGNFSGSLADARGALAIDPANERARETAHNAQSRLGEDMSAPAAANPWGAGGAAARLLGETAGPRAAMSAQEKQSLDFLAEGNRLLGMKDYSGARSAYDRSIDQNPMNANAHLDRAWLGLNHGGSLVDALADLKTVLKVAPKGAPGAIQKMAKELLKARNYKEAKSVLELLAPDQRDASAWYDLAAANYGLGDRDAMMSALQRAAQLDAARYGAKYESAKESALGADLDFLFDQLPAQSREQPARAPAGAWRLERLVTLGLGGLVGLLLIAFGIMHGSSLSERWTTRSRDALASQAQVDEIPAAPPEESSANTVGHFDLVRQIGLGGMGIVYEGLDRTLGRRVAIKKMREEIRVDPRERERFMAEARTVAQLRHPNIVEIHSIIEKGDDVYLVFEFVEGSTLYETLDRRGRLPLAEAVRVAEQAGEALAYAHKHDIIHRDLKPSNVMLGDGGAVKVMDFGVARQAKDAVSKLSMTNTIVGTPPYMAPEQEQGVVCKESDVYALGICFYELVTGRLPFQGTGAGMLLNKLNKAYAPATTLAPELPVALDEFFAKAFEPEPARRFRTVTDFLSALRAVTAKR